MTFVIMVDVDALLNFCHALNARRASYELSIARDDAVMVRVVAPGQYFEIEFFRDGRIEVEPFISEGVTEASQAKLDEILSFWE